MHKREAELILNGMLSLKDDIGKIDDVITNMSDENEKKLWVRKLGGLIGYLLNEIQAPIVREYPDLDPYQSSR